MKRTSDSSAEMLRKSRAKAIRKNGSVTTSFTRPTPHRLRKGKACTAYITAKRMPGDKVLVFGELPKKPSFIGGEGGRGWSVRSTIC